MSEYSIYKQFSKPELVQRCLDLGVNRVGLLADNKRLRSEVEEKHRLNMEYANEVLRLRAELAALLAAIEAMRVAGGAVEFQRAFDEAKIIAARKGEGE